MRRLALLLLAALSIGGVARAGIYYESTHQSEGGPQGVSEFQIRGWAEGDQAKIEFVQSAANGMMCEGCYLLTEDAGHTLYLVDPNKETYSRWDLDAMLGMVGSVMESGLVNVEFSTPESEQLLSEPGEEILGRSTNHVRWRNRYDMELKVMGFKQRNSIEIVQDLWMTEALADRGMNVWLRAEPPKTGNQGFDDMLAAEMKKTTGMPLRSKTVTTTVNKKGKATVTQESMEVTQLETRNIEEKIFTLPVDYEEVPMMPVMGGEEEQESPMEGLRGLLGRKKKNRN